MSLVAISLNLLLAGLLIAALAVGVRLQRSLKAVRDGQLDFAKAVAELDRSTMQAREGLGELRAATDEATDILGGRIARAREAAERLDSLVKRAEGAVAAPSSPAAAGPEGGLAALLQRIKESDAAPQVQVRGPAVPDKPLRLHRSADDDLFEESGARP